MSVAQRSRRQAEHRPETAVELSIVMPCLNEAETLATCIRKARAAIEKHDLAAEIIVADNGSTDGSQLIAEELGARVVDVARRGYGRALIGGIAAARGALVIKASMPRIKSAEVPVTLSPDGRSRPPHLRTWRDGWRHLRFMLLFSPRWLFLYPGLALFVAGAVAGALLETGPKQIGPATFDIHTLLLAGFACLIGYQLIVFAVFTKVFAMQRGFHPPNPGYDMMFRYVKLETGLLLGAVMVLVGIAGTIVAVTSWGAEGFGSLDPRLTMREVIPAAVLLTLGVQTIFASFFLSILGMDEEAGRAT